MPAHSVELLLDAASDAAVRGQWDALAAAGLPSLAGHGGETNAPHVTLVALSRAPTAEVEAALVDAVAGLPIETALGPLMVFGERRVVLVRSVVPTASLLDLQSRVHDTARADPGLLPHFGPGRWTPHVTLSRGLPPERLGEAVVTLGRASELPVCLTAARRWDPDARRVWLLQPR